MYSTIQKWGNSQAVRIPKGILEDADLRENDRVEIKAEKNCIIIRRINKKHKTLQERLEGYEGDYIAVEWDTGSLRGKEL
ncbi:MAG: AbrB/MazE/SpoVT family DNA-binding domain-containing protein [Syntrophomonas sp.]|nr:AbrB/MazE/SpoVT family DNA-binding domain-containing protein [Syntrophomonas sp.]